MRHSQHTPTAVPRDPANVAPAAWLPSHPPVPSAAHLWQRLRRDDLWGKVAPRAR